MAHDTQTDTTLDDVATVNDAEAHIGDDGEFDLVDPASIPGNDEGTEYADPNGDNDDPEAAADKATAADEPEPAPSPAKPVAKGKADQPADKPSDAAVDATKKPNTAAAKPADDNSGISAKLLKEAETYGISKEMALGLGSDDAIEYFMALMDQQAAGQKKTGEEPDENASPDPGDKLTPEPEAEKPADTPPTEPAKKPAAKAIADAADKPADPVDIEKLEKLNMGLEKFQFDDDTNAALNKINDHYHGLFDAMRKEFAAAKQGLQAIAHHLNEGENTRIESEVDAFIDSLKMPEVFGSGPIRELEPQSPAVKARAELFQHAETLRKGALASGRKPKSLSERLRLATRLLPATASKQEKTIREGLVKQVERRRRMATSRPNSRQVDRSHDLTPDQRAMRGIAEALGEAPSDGGDEDIDV